MSIASMTGFGKATEETPLFRLSVQIRSVNGKGLKINQRLPDLMTLEEEAELETRLKSKLRRGSVQVEGRFRPGEGFIAAKLNITVLDSYRRQLTGHFHSENIPVEALLSLPGVVEENEREEAILSEVRERFWSALDKAVASLLESRRVEGQALYREFQERLKVMGSLLTNIRERAEVLPELYRKRLESRIKEALESQGVSLKPEDLVRETAFYVDRSDIQEEIVRLGAHLVAFQAALDGKEPEVGRKLEFLAQEMLREANTMGSKSIDTALGADVIRIKTEVDRLKEQVMNVE